MTRKNWVYLTFIIVSLIVLVIEITLIYARHNQPGIPPSNVVYYMEVE